ncbi:hypothetical protein LCGC14_1403300, partial [marine sediment metagenome]
MKIMAAKFKSKCFACDVQIKVGDQIEWSVGTGAAHVDCELACAQQNSTDKRTSESITQLGDFSDVYALFEKAATGGKWPRITINADGFEFHLYVSGAKSVVPGVINVKRSGSAAGNGHGDWYGRITIEGAWDQRHSEVDERMADALSKLAMDPVGTVAMYGRLSGKCCFCKKQLTDDPSVEAGYGPVCAKRWGLPWGGKTGGIVFTDGMVASILKEVKALDAPAVTALQNPGHVWGMTYDGEYGPVTKVVTDPPPIAGTFVEEAKPPYVMAGNEYPGPLQEYGVDVDEITDKAHIDAIKKTKAGWDAADELAPSECESCYDTKLVDGEPCLYCVPAQG